MRCGFVLRTFCFFFLGLLLLPSCPAQTPPESNFFSTVAEERFSTYQMTGNGDLWPSCWANDDNLYAANGDGTGFGKFYTDMAVSRISGTPEELTGTTIADNVGTNWSGSIYTRKPTGMLCRGGAIYLAFQNLNESTFDDAPAASIAKSVDNGVTWTWNTKAPMFGKPMNAASPKAYKFTTIFFLDYGKDSANAIDGYVYAYGLDNNWRSQETMFLGRVPADQVQARNAWEFYAGTNVDGAPVWTTDITQKLPVLTDTRLLYPIMFGPDCPPYQQVIAQGGVTYDAPLRKYIFASWSCSTHEFYEASQPWGPWKHFQSTDFGPLRLTQNRGQYGTSIPSKFISADGRALWLQSNVCCGGDSYRFSLRRLHLRPAQPSSASNGPSTDNLALSPGTRAISKSTHFGTLCGRDCSDQLNSGDATVSEDDYDEQVKTTDWWGYTWPKVYNINQVVYTTGTMFPNGGWYEANLRVQVRQNFKWVDVSGVTVTPPYPYTADAGNFTSYTFSLPNTWGDGVRIIGQPGSTGYFTSINQLGVYFQAEDSVH
ncbi:MAG: DUF4185 domain-containing protein [Candidatus Sulfotelmatobacter sp.]